MKKVFYIYLILMSTFIGEGFSGGNNGKMASCPNDIKVADLISDASVRNLSIYRELIGIEQTMNINGKAHKIKTVKFHSPTKNLNLTLGRTIEQTHIITAELNEDSHDTCKYIKRWALQGGEPLELDVVIEK